METGYRGTYLFPWAHTTIDGLTDAPTGALCVGATWEWNGLAHRVDGPDSLLSLHNPLGETELRRRMVHKLRRFIGRQINKDFLDTAYLNEVEDQQSLTDSGFVVTNGAQVFRGALLEVGFGGAPLVVFEQGVPPAGQEFWVASVGIRQRPKPPLPSLPGGMAGTTRIDTPAGHVRAQDLTVGDWVVSLTGVAQQVIWTAQTHVSGARLHAMPGSRPLRLHGKTADLIVSPAQQLLLQGAAAQTLFNTDAVLVRADDLQDDNDRLRFHPAGGVTYVHLVTQSCGTLCAQGHVLAGMDPEEVYLLSPDDQKRLFVALQDHGSPDVRPAVMSRRLTQPEAALYRYAAA